MNELLRGILEHPDDWGQFQIYREDRETIALERAGALDGVFAQGNRLALACDNLFRRDRVEWTRLGVTKLLFPLRSEPVQAIQCKMTPGGRAVLDGFVFPPRARLVFIRKDDAGEPEEWIAPLDIPKLVASAREECTECLVADPSSHEMDFSCGHRGPVSYGYSIFGRSYTRTRRLGNENRDWCAECSLARLIENITRCHACRGPILKGRTYYVYNDRIFCERAQCSAGPMGSPAYNWNGALSPR